jgi:myotubularin-related protein 6/7/8
MINYCSFRPSPPASHQPPSIRLRCRDFNFIAFHFEEDSQARPVFDTIRQLTCRLEHMDKLYAFSYRPTASERGLKGWSLYSPLKELERMGITQETRRQTGWRISNINLKYEVGMLDVVVAELTHLTVLCHLSRCALCSK